MTPRDVRDYEAQARALWVKELLFARPEKEGIAVLAAALRAEGKAALERAAQVADEEHAEAWKSSRAADARGDHRVGAADAISAATAQRIAFVIRALIALAPESPPGPAAYADALQDQVHKTPGKLLSSRPLRTPAPMVTCSTDTDEHHGAHRLREPTRGEESWCKDPIPASAHESPPATDPIHEAYLAADEDGQSPVAPAPDLRDLLKQAADMLRSRASTDEDRAYVACFDTALASPDPRDQRIAEPQPPYWRNGRHYGIHVYRGDTPIATFHAVEDAKAAVRAYNASVDAPARYVVPAPRLADAEKRIAELEEHLRGAYRQNREPPRDFACADCRPGSEMLVKGFRCWWHVGESLVRSASRPGAATGGEG